MYYIYIYTHYIYIYTLYIYTHYIYIYTHYIYIYLYTLYIYTLYIYTPFGIPMKGLYAYCITIISPSQRRRLEDHHPIVKELAKPAAGWDDAARHGFNQVDMCNIM